MSEPMKRQQLWWRRPWVWVVLVAVAGLVTFALIDEVEPPDKLVLPTYVVSAKGLAELNPGFGEYYRAHVDPESLTLSNFRVGNVDVVDADGRLFYQANNVQAFVGPSIMLAAYKLFSDHTTFTAMDRSLSDAVERLEKLGCIDMELAYRAAHDVSRCPRGDDCCPRAMPYGGLRASCPTRHPSRKSIHDFEISLGYACLDDRFTVNAAFSLSIEGEAYADPLTTKQFIDQMAKEADAMLP